MMGGLWRESPGCPNHVPDFPNATQRADYERGPGSDDDG
jgi:hypothetical protein